MNIYILFLIYCIILLIVVVYIIKRLINKININNNKKLYIKIFLILTLISALFYKLGRNLAELGSIFNFLASISIGILFILFCVAILYDVAILFTSKFSKTRRDSLKNIFDTSVPFVAFLLTAKTTYNAMHIEIEDVEIKIKNLKRDYKVVQISDIHIGTLIEANHMESIVNKINLLNADVVVITGDLVDIELNKAKDALDKLKAIKSKYGIYYIVGNREYLYNMGKVMNTIRTLGIVVLENENIYVGEKNKGFNIIGVYDINGYILDIFRPNLDKALIGVRKDYPKVLLAHQPRYIKEVKDRVDLMLSGHTHGGQIFPFQYLVKLQQIYLSGLHHHTDKVQIYVNKGVGFSGPPMRLGTSSEISNITLKASS